MFYISGLKAFISYTFIYFPSLPFELVCGTEPAGAEQRNYSRKRLLLRWTARAHPGLRAAASESVHGRQRAVRGSRASRGHSMKRMREQVNCDGARFGFTQQQQSRGGMESSVLFGSLCSSLASSSCDCSGDPAAFWAHGGRWRLSSTCCVSRPAAPAPAPQGLTITAGSQRLQP